MGIIGTGKCVPPLQNGSRYRALDPIDCRRRLPAESLSFFRCQRPPATLSGTPNRFDSRAIGAQTGGDFFCDLDHISSDKTFSLNTASGLPAYPPKRRMTSLMRDSVSFSTISMRRALASLIFACSASISAGFSRKSVAPIFIASTPFSTVA